MLNSLQKDQYSALRETVGWVDSSDRARIEISGQDRVTFLNGFCTNDVKRLSPGQGCEAFITNVKGKTVGHVLVFCMADRFVLDSSPGQAETLVNHLDRYVIREDVVLTDVSTLSASVLIGGKDAAATIERMTGVSAEAYLEHRECEIGGIMATLHRTDILGDTTMLLAFDAEHRSTVAATLTAAGITQCGADIAEIRRVESGFPRFGKDITDDNLPQEVARDDRAISFTKGCYLGQETVARLDALGHVNRMLVAVKLIGNDIPSHGTELVADGKTVGHVTSAIWSPVLSAPLALAYVRHAWTSVGASLATENSPGEVIAVPC